MFRPLINITPLLNLDILTQVSAGFPCIVNSPFSMLPGPAKQVHLQNDTVQTWITVTDDGKIDKELGRTVNQGRKVQYKSRILSENCRRMLNDDFIHQSRI